MEDVETQKPPSRQRNDMEEIELEEPNYQDVDWRRFLSWRYIPAYLAIIAAIVLIVLIAADKNQIVSKLTPIAEKIRAVPAGWLIPIAILILLSIPPLFGHEIIALLCGIVYGLGIGFGIVAAGTFFGELLTWYLFKYVLQKRARKLELTNLNYAALARVIRDGGFWIIVLVRLSVVPSHMSTAVFATTGVKFWHFVVATFLALPKQLVVVYLGVLLGSSANDKVAKALVFVIGGALTFVASVYILWRLRTNRKALLAEQVQRRAKHARETGTGAGRFGGSTEYEGGLDGRRASLAEPNHPLMA